MYKISFYVKDNIVSLSSIFYLQKQTTSLQNFLISSQKQKNKKQKKLPKKNLC